MNTEAIERIKGYCCEVTQEQWDELVRVADEVGVKVGYWCGSAKVKPDNFARLAFGNAILGLYPDRRAEHKKIPFPDFLSKLKGEEKWEPKAGEVVEVSTNGVYWMSAEPSYFISSVENGKRHIVWDAKDRVYLFEYIRPLRPTITRTEAEQLLKKRIID